VLFRSGVETQCAAVESWLEHLDAHDHNALYHIDPGRRIADAHNTGKRRIRRLADYQPGPEFLRRLIGRLPHGAVKLGPGIEFHDLADQLTDHLPAHELEFISEQGRLVQAVLWTGELATQASHGAQGSAIIALRTATRLPDAVSLTGQPGDPPIGPMQLFLHTVDPVVERAQLLHVLCAQTRTHAIHPALGILTGNEAVDSPWLTPFEMIAELPWRLKKVKAWLQAHNGGIVVVKTRGKAVNPDQVQQQLRGKGDETFTIFVLRFGQQVRALITRRLTIKPYNATRQSDPQP